LLKCKRFGAQLVERWRGDCGPSSPREIFQAPDGEKDPAYSERSGLRFQQWVLDTCLRPYDQNWLNYQQEMALRHTSVKKNKTDQVDSAPMIHLRHILAFNAVMSDPAIMKPLLATKGHSASEVESMHRAWSKSL
jgi:Protoglobin